MAETGLRCSFCHKTQRQVKKLIAGPDVYICDECVDICLNLLVDGPGQASPEPEPESEHGMGRVIGVPEHLRTTCALCDILFPMHQALAVRNRGLLCPGCVSAIEASLAVE